MNDICLIFPGGKRVEATMGNHHIVTDQTLAQGGDDSAPDPFELFLASLATCAGSYVASFCQTRGIATQSIELVQHHELDGNGHLRQVHLQLRLPRSFPERYRAAVVRVAEGCKVQRALQSPPTIRVSAVFVPGHDEPDESAAALNVTVLERQSCSIATRAPSVGCHAMPRPMNDSEALPPVPAATSLDEVARVLVSIEAELRALEVEMAAAIEAVPPKQRDSARNLVHYVALRQRDLRELQEQLAQQGLSSLGRAESCVMGGLLQAAIRAHESLALRDGSCPELARLAAARESAMPWPTAKSYLHQHTVDVFGPRPADRHIYVMVTAPSAAEADTNWMVKLLEAGMNVLRINCAHESDEEWGRMIDALARATDQTGKSCRVVMDLAGPKIRTGVIASARRSAAWKPARNELGLVTEPAHVVIRRASALREPALLSLAEEAFDRLRVADELRFRDYRDKRRTLLIE
ncbi:MAG: pyruvate kinase, partial [Polyangiaceae bacterium]